jgi:uncharacterized protein YjbI with pentapeptide repeats
VSGSPPEAVPGPEDWSGPEDWGAPEDLTEPGDGPAPIRDAIFRGEDWYGEEMSDRAFAGCLFEDVDLTEAATARCVFTECTFGRVRFNASRHADSAFLRCTFTGCNLFEAQFTGCKLIGSAFQECDLRPLRVTGGDWSFVTLVDADLRGVILEEVRMREVDLSGANCDLSVLRGVDLSGAQLRAASFFRADLRGSDLTAFDLRTVQMPEAVITAEQAVVLAQAVGLVIG